MATELCGSIPFDDIAHPPNRGSNEAVMAIRLSFAFMCSIFSLVCILVSVVSTLRYSSPVIRLQKYLYPAIFALTFFIISFRFVTQIPKKRHRDVQIRNIAASHHKLSIYKTSTYMFIFVNSPHIPERRPPIPAQHAPRLPLTTSQDHRRAIST